MTPQTTASAPQIALTPATIGETTFRIPLYQRPYAWEAAQVERLLFDLFGAFKACSGADYPIGILSVAPMANDTHRLDLIDGQQRITTLLLIGGVARIFAADWSAFARADRLHLYGRRNDQAYLERGGPEDSACNPRMKEAVRVAKTFFESLGQDAGPFACYVYHHAAFFLSTVPKDYTLLDKNQQFVRLNNRGRQLEKHEILKVRLLGWLDESTRQHAALAWNEMVAAVSGQKQNGDIPVYSLDRILLESGLDKPAGSEEVLTRSLVSVPEFLLIALARCLKTSAGPGLLSWSPDRLLETFDVLQSQGEVQSFMALLTSQTQLLKRYFVFQSQGGEYDFNSTESESPMDFGDDAAVAAPRTATNKARLVTLQSFLHVSTDPHHWLLPAFDWCEQVQRTNSVVKAAAFTAALEGIDNSLLRDRKRSVSDIGSLSAMTYQQVSHYWFYRLDYELWKCYHKVGSSDEVWAALPREDGADAQVHLLVRRFRFRRCGSVEHIRPQHPMEAARDGIPADHSFGNLALISGSRNSKFSNNECGSKKELILRSEFTESLKMLHFLWCDGNPMTAGESMHKILLAAVRESLTPKA